MCRIRIMQTNPLYTRNFRDTFDQFRQHLLFIQIDSVIRQFLSDHLELLYPLRYQIPDFIQYFFHRLGYMASCNNGNSTIRALAVTSF